MTQQSQIQKQTKFEFKPQQAAHRVTRVPSNKLNILIIVYMSEVSGVSHRMMVNVQRE